MVENKIPGGILRTSNLKKNIRRPEGRYTSVGQRLQTHALRPRRVQPCIARRHH